MSTPDDEIRARIESFAAELADLVRRATLDVVRGALGGAAPPAAPAPVEVPAKRGPPCLVPAKCVPAVGSPGGTTPGMCGYPDAMECM